jgi:hypothetical protein
LRYRGEKKNFVRPDDGTPASYIDVIILGQAKNKSKSYYKKFDPNQDGERPICASIDGVTPDPDVTQKQCDSCILCPRNEWKINPETGKKGRECSDYKRIAVLVLPTQTAPLFGAPVLEPAFLRVPPASLNALAIMGDSMSGQGYHYSSYITRISFDPNEAHPKMVFVPQQGLTDNEAPVVLKMRQDANVDRIISGGYAEGIRTVPPQAGTTLVQPTGLTQIEPPKQQPVAGVGVTINATANPPPPAQQPATISTGLGGLESPQQAAASAAQSEALKVPAQPVGDAAAPDAADLDLDAQIASMLGGKK